MYTAMVKDPFRKWDRVDTVCALLVDLGIHMSDNLFVFISTFTEFPKGASQKFNVARKRKSVAKGRGTRSMA